MRELHYKQGETLNLEMQFENDCAAVDVSQMTLTAFVRDAQDNLVASLPLVKQPALGLVTVSAVSTALWPIGMLRCDLAAAFDGQVIKTETFAIRIARAVTT